MSEGNYPPYDPSRLSAIAKAIVDDSKHFHAAPDEERGALVLGMKDELLAPLAHENRAAIEALSRKADHVGTLTADGGTDVGIFAIQPNFLSPSTRLNSFELTREIVSKHGATLTIETENSSYEVPRVTPHHVAVVSGNGDIGINHYDTCPKGPPSKALPSPKWRIDPSGKQDQPIRIGIIDTGFVTTDTKNQIKSNPELDARKGIGSVKGKWFSKMENDWVPSGPDTPSRGATYDGLMGHGAFVAGIVARWCPFAKITIVGLRHECWDMPKPDPKKTPVPPGTPLGARLCTNEGAIWYALQNQLGDQDIVICSFAFPTLAVKDDAGRKHSMKSQLANLLNSPHFRPLVIAPAGNEQTSAEYWPAAHHKVAGVGSTNRGAKAVSNFSNWAEWVKIAAPGENVFSTFVTWPVGEPQFDGWATWNGTSFAAPKVAAVVANVMSKHKCNAHEAWDLVRTKKDTAGWPTRDVCRNEITKPALVFDDDPPPGWQ